MQNTRKNTAKRQVPDAFEVGDQIEVAITVMGVLVGKEAAANGDWHFTVELAELATNTTETVENGDGGRKVAKRIRPVLWSVTDGGGIELVLDVGSKQLLRSVGVSAKRRQSIRKELAALPGPEVEKLLQEITGHNNQASEKTNRGRLQ